MPKVQDAGQDKKMWSSESCGKRLTNTQEMKDVTFNEEHLATITAANEGEEIGLIEKLVNLSELNITVDEKNLVLLM